MEEPSIPGDGFITGYGRIEGRLVYVFAPGLHSSRNLALKTGAVAYLLARDDSAVQGRCPRAADDPSHLALNLLPLAGSRADPDIFLEPK
jgi:hypothetical protein